jgi:toxin-antitoxin system, antitoxin component, xre family
MMATIFDASKHILADFDYPISTRKLQKLAYFSQGWALALVGEPIFSEDFEAWKHGPVARELFNAHRGMYSIDEEELAKGDAGNLSDRDKIIIDAVLRNYGGLTGDQLSDLTHAKGAPWEEARKRANAGSDDACREKVRKEDMREYFKEILLKRD